MDIVILAGGKGARMKGAVPKTLQMLADRPLLGHVLRTARALSPSGIHIIIAPKTREQYRQHFPDEDLNWVVQKEPLGTGHAVAQAMPDVKGEGPVMILYGDVPMVRAETLRALLEEAGDNAAALLTAELPDPAGCGRILRDEKDKDRVLGIVEERDADEKQRAITEVCVGPMVVQASFLRRWIPQLKSENAQGEFYLTDMAAMACDEGTELKAVTTRDAFEAAGFNDLAQLSWAEREFQLRRAAELMLQGVRIADPNRFDLRGDAQCGADVFIDVGVVLSGELRIDGDVHIGPYCVVENAHIGRGTRLESHCNLRDVRIGKNCVVGPYARLRPGTVIEDDSHIGNFVEIKKSHVGRGSKINHLSYVGDATLGEGVNIGAGVITCNYDGERKHPTTIGNGAFIGSNASLIAPINIGAGAVVAASAAISEDVPAGALAVERSPQKSVFDWKQRRRKPRAGKKDD